MNNDKCSVQRIQQITAVRCDVRTVDALFCSTSYDMAARIAVIAFSKDARDTGR